MDEYSVYVVWECPECPWTRTRTDTREWDNQIIVHPVHGPVRNIELYRLDILSHDCETTRRIRLKYGFGKINKNTKRLMIERKLRNG